MVTVDDRHRNPVYTNGRLGVSTGATRCAQQIINKSECTESFGVKMFTNNIQVILVT